MLAAALIFILLVLQVLDYRTTKTILAFGGKELNPAMRWLMDRVGVEEALTLKGTAVVVVAITFFREYVLALVAMDVIFLAVVLFNYRSMPK